MCNYSLILDTELEISQFKTQLAFRCLYSFVSAVQLHRGCVHLAKGSGCFLFRFVHTFFSPLFGGVNPLQKGKSVLNSISLLGEQTIDISRCTKRSLTVTRVSSPVCKPGSINLTNIKLKQLPDLLAINSICECSQVWESGYSQTMCQFGNFSHTHLAHTQGFDINCFGVGLFLPCGLFDPSAIESCTNLSIDLDQLVTV